MSLEVGKNRMKPWATWLKADLLRYSCDQMEANDGTSKKWAATR